MAVIKNVDVTMNDIKDHFTLNDPEINARKSLLYDYPGCLYLIVYL